MSGIKSTLSIANWTILPVRRLLSLTLSSQMLRIIHREHAPGQSSTMAFAFRSVHKSQYCIQSASRRYSSVVLSRPYIQRLEVRWFIFMGTRKTCVSLKFHSNINPNHVVSVAGSGKSILWFVLPLLVQFYQTHAVNSAPPSYNIL